MIRRITAIVILLVIATAPRVITADSTLDFEIAEGHFYTQGSGLASPSVQKGFIVSDADDVLFLSGFNKLGGVSVLGYPISRRFIWQERVSQLTQRALMQWDGNEEKVNMFELFDYFGDSGWDVSLRERKSIPMRLPMSSEEQELSADEFAMTRIALLDEDPTIKSFYLSSLYAARLYGLPTSRPEDLGPFVAMRFQRVVLQKWKIDSDVAKAGDVTIVNGGSLATELGLFAEDVLEPVDVPPADRRRPMPASRGGDDTLWGVATWYGADFHGSIMRNGEVYNMYDATTTASNSHPMGTRLRVTSVATGKSITVRVTDTGAFRYPIVVDLSWAAFRQLADPDQGVIDVMVEPLRDD